MARSRTVTIRGEPHTALVALQRGWAHYAYHLGQMVYIVRLRLGDRWQTLSIPRGGSAAFNQRIFGRSSDASTPSSE